MDKAIVEKILFEIEQIDFLLREAQPIIVTCKNNVPNFWEKCGISQILHSFYNGIEKILLLLIKNNEFMYVNADRWHSELFAKAFEMRINGTQIFRSELKELLSELLKFRHVVRNSYGFDLEWDKMINMVYNLENTWEMAKTDIKECLGRENS